MSKDERGRYGFVGWKEFISTRQEILNEIDQSKCLNSSRPVKTQHGVAFEAAVRRWLQNFLPKRYAVTPGFVVPDLLAKDYKLKHFDVLIYDAHNAPILWIDGTADNSDQGKTRAIPAPYVVGAMECKASLTMASAQDAVLKLAEFGQFQPHLPESFSSAIVFADLNLEAVEGSVLENLIPREHLPGYSGGIILRSSVDSEASGLFFLAPAPAERAPVEGHPIVKPMSAIDLRINENGLMLPAQASAMFLAGPDQQWHVSKAYTAHAYKELVELNLIWSHNSFSTFAIRLLGRLEGRASSDRKYAFGQVFDLTLSTQIEPPNSVQA